MHSPAKGSGTCSLECSLSPRVPTCAAGVFVQWKWNNLTQYTFVPAENGAELGACVCKAASCLRWAGLRAEAKQAGRKRKAEAPAAMATLVNGIAFDRVGDLSGRHVCPAFIDEIHEVWGCR